MLKELRPMARLGDKRLPVVIRIRCERGHVQKAVVSTDQGLTTVYLRIELGRHSELIQVPAQEMRELHNAY